MSKKSLRRSGAKIMASLILLLGSLAYIMVLAVLNGSLGFVSAMGVTVFGAAGVAKALGEEISLSYGSVLQRVLYRHGRREGGDKYVFGRCKSRRGCRHLDCGRCALLCRLGSGNTCLKRTEKSRSP